MTKFHLEEKEDLTLTHIKERLKLVEQCITDDQATDNAANKGGATPKKEDRKCFHCHKKSHIKVKCYKWLATDVLTKRTKPPIFLPLRDKLGLTKSISEGI